MERLYRGCATHEKDELSAEIEESNELLYMNQFLWCRPFLDCSHLDGIDSEFVLADEDGEEFYDFLIKLAFVFVEEQLVFS